MSDKEEEENKKLTTRGLPEHEKDAVRREQNRQVSILFYLLRRPLLLTRADKIYIVRATISRKAPGRVSAIMRGASGIDDANQGD